MKALRRTAPQAAASSRTLRRAPMQPARASHERQANAAAQRFMHGERGLHQMLTPAPAGAFVLPASRGQPLAPPLRRELESAFGADLSTVRLHCDAAAADAASILGARAFASGTHVYFGAGEFRAQRAGGRELLAHEIAHVLQQTGRVGSGGQIVASALTGCAPVQMMPGFETMRRRHGGKKPSVEFGKIADALEALGDTRKDVEQFAKNRWTTIGTWPVEAESLLYDDLKRVEAFDVAAEMIERDGFNGGKRIRSTEYSEKLVESLKKRSSGDYVFYRAIKREPRLQLYYGEMLRLVEMFLLQPTTRKTPPLLRNLDPEAGAASKSWQDIAAHLAEVWARYSDANAPGENEWFYNGLARLKSLNDSRITACDHARSKVEERFPQSDVWRRRNLVAYVRSWAASTRTSYFEKDDGTGKKVRDEEETARWKPFFDDFADKLDAIVARIDSVWGAREAFELARIEYRAAQAKDARARIAPEQAGVLKAVQREAVASGVAAALVAMMNALNASDKAGGRIPEDYAARSQKHADALRKLLRSKLDDSMLYLFRKNQLERLEAMLWLEGRVEKIIDLLEWREPPFGAERKAGPQVQVVETSPDVVIGHRLAIAYRIHELASLLGSDELLAAAREVAEAKKEKESVLSLLPDESGKLWRQDDVSSDKIIKDFSDKAIKGNEPLTPYEMLLMYRADYLEQLRARLEVALPGTAAEERKAIARAPSSSILTTESRATRTQMEQAGQKPERWFVPDKHVFFAKHAKGDEFGDVLLARAASEPWYAKARANGMQFVRHEHFAGRAFIWAFPPYARSVEVLRGIAALNELVASKLFGASDAKAIEQLRKVENAKWLTTVRDILQVKLDPKSDARFSEAELRSFDSRVETAIEAHYQAEKAKLDPLVQHAARIDRRVLTAKFAGRLMAVKDEHMILRDKACLAVAEDINRLYLQLLAVFETDIKYETELTSGARALRIMPDAKARLHLAALMLELAGAAAAVFQHSTTGNVVLAWLGLLEDAAESIDLLWANKQGERAIYLSEEQRSDAWVSANQAIFRSVLKRLQEFQRSVQMESGFSADDASSTLSVRMAYSSPIGPGEVLLPRTGQGFMGADTTGKRYRLIKVLRSFVYHPPFGGVESGRRLGYGKPILKEADNTTDLKPGGALLRIDELDANDDTIRSIDVGFETSQDFKLLAELYSGAAYLAFGKSMENIQKGIEKAVDTMLDLAELIPGWGQLITGARVVVAISAFWASGAYDDLRKVVNGDLHEIMAGLYDKLKEAAEPGFLIEQLMFPDPTIEAILSKATDFGTAKSDKLAAKRDVATRGKFAAVRKTFEAIKKLGRAFSRALKTLNVKVQRPVEDFQEYVSVRPALAFAVHFAASHLYELEALAHEAVVLALTHDDDAAAAAKEGVDLKDGLRRLLGVEQKDIGRRVHAIMFTLEHLELPERLIDITPAVQFVLDEMISFVGGKLGLEAKFVIIILRRSGAMDYFTEKIARELVESGFDPNVYWREDVLPLVSDKFNALRTSTVDALNKVLKQPAFGGLFDEIPKGDVITLEPNTESTYPELLTGTPPAPAPADDRVPAVSPAAVPAFGAGSKLTRGLRQRYESEFGHDFSHVRLHAGSEGEAMTRAYGVDALTSGSHVFLRHGLDPRGGRGEGVMRHELAHVLQQGGARPVGARQSPRPVRGQTQAGLRFMPESEAEAERIASDVRNRRSGSPVAIGSRAAAGWQPFAFDNLSPYTVARLLRRVSSVKDIEERERHYESARRKEDVARTADREAIEAAINFLTSPSKVRAALIETPKVFSQVQEDILKVLADNFTADRVTRAIFRIASEAQIDLPVKRGSKDKPERVVAAGHFIRQLEGYVLAKTGIALGIEAKPAEHAGPTGKKVDVLDRANPIKSLKLLTVFLPFIDTHTNLWRKALENTWTGKSSKDMDKLRPEVKTLLLGKGITAVVWAHFTSAYKFSALFKNEIDEIMSQKVTGGGALDPKDLPAPEVYVKTKAPSNIGVRIATYGDPSQKAPGRHSHHLTQFLMAEYFANESDSKKPFKPKRDYPGIRWNKKQVALISDQDQPTEDKSVQVARTFGSSRGEKMPAISLAAATHMGGDLHITPGPDDLGLAKRKTQAHAVDYEFRKRVPKELLPEAGETEYSAFVRRTGRPVVAKQIHKAVNETYLFWSAHMRRQLIANMPRLELEYYRTVAGASPTQTIKNLATDVAQQTHLLEKLRDAAKEAGESNLAEMANLGWK